MKRLVFATNNQHKLEEVRTLLREEKPELADQIQILSLSDIGCHEDIPETGMTFSDNALQKAEYVKVHYDVDCFADDSGLEVRALGMEPGVFSARYANDEGYRNNSDANTEKLLRKMQNMKERQAQFRTVICLLMGSVREEFEGVCRGEITRTPSGSKGFGYDPVFIPEGHNVTFAEMAMVDKNLISHRGKAFRALLDYLEQQQ